MLAARLALAVFRAEIFRGGTPVSPLSPKISGAPGVRVHHVQ